MLDSLLVFMANSTIQNIGFSVIIVQLSLSLSVSGFCSKVKRTAAAARAHVNEGRSEALLTDARDKHLALAQLRSPMPSELKTLG